MGEWWNGRHEGLRSLYRKMCRFKSCLAHQFNNFSGRKYLGSRKPVYLWEPKLRGHTARLPTQRAVQKKISTDIGDDSPADEPIARRRRSLPPVLHFMAACWNGRQP